MLRKMAAEYAAQGWDVTVFTAQPSYHGMGSDTRQPKKERMEGFDVVRVSLLREAKGSPVRRLLNAILFAVRLVAHCIAGRRYDLITVTTMPPAVMGTAARVIRRLVGTPYVYHCQDLHPEAALAAGVMREGVVTRIMSWIDRQNCQKAGAVVVLSEDMRDTLAGRGLDTKNVYVINNFIVDSVESTEGLHPPLERKEGEFRVVFAGNMGRFQGLDTVVRAAPRLQDKPEIHLVFMGAGGAVGELKRLSDELGAENISFLPHQPTQIALRMMQESDLGIVSIRPEIYRCAFPSKLAMYLEAGCRVVTIVEPHSQLSRFVVESDVGRTCEPGDHRGIARAIEEEYERARSSEIDRERIQELGRRSFGFSELAPFWIRLFGEVACGGRRSHLEV